MENSSLHRWPSIPWICPHFITPVCYWDYLGFCDFKQCCNKCLWMDIIAHICKYLEDNILKMELLDQRVNALKILMDIGKFSSKTLHWFIFPSTVSRGIIFLHTGQHVIKYWDHCNFELKKLYHIVTSMFFSLGIKEI